MPTDTGGHDPERCAGEHPLLLALLSEVLRPGDVFIDIGANTGLFAVPLARAVGSEGRVVAFEPAEDAASLLRAEARLHGVEPRIEIHQIALGSKDASAVLRADPRASSRSSSTPSSSSVRAAWAKQSGVNDNSVPRDHG
jgi:FkbM family methyltransferase